MAATVLESLLRTLHGRISAVGTASQSDAYLLTRFREHADEECFRTLLVRHGPLVLNACRQILREESDVEDAFQATFVVLFRKATSIREGQALAAWLFRTARRLALRLRATSEQRRRREGQSLPSDPTPAAPPDLTWSEAGAILHEELDRLPDRFRLPIVLCYLQGLSRDEAARHLGWSLGMVKGRLERGRQRLRQRLVKRGIGLTAGLWAVLESSPAMGAGVSPRLVDATRLAITGSPSSAVGMLAMSELGGLTMRRIATLAILIIVISASVSSGWLIPAAPPSSAYPLPPQATAPPAANATEDERMCWGRVLTPDGQPFGGARIYAPDPSSMSDPRISPSPVLATSAPDGTFRFSLKRRKGEAALGLIFATAKGHGFAWCVGPDPAKPQELTLRLTRDDVPIRGRIVDPEGRPVGGATVRIKAYYTGYDLRRDDLTSFADMVRTARDNRQLNAPHRLMPLATSYHVPGLPQSTTTDKDGRLELREIGVERIVEVQIEGPTMASTQAWIATRELPTVRLLIDRDVPQLGSHTFHGATFTHNALPTQIVVGTVRNRDTGKPIAGARIHSNRLPDSDVAGRDFIRATTDAEGRYRLVGLPRQKGNHILFLSPESEPYVPNESDVQLSADGQPITIDLTLRRGVWITGRVVDKKTGQPVAAQRVAYSVMGNNPHLRDYPRLDLLGDTWWRHSTQDDGTFRLVALPGPGVIAVGRPDGYLTAELREDAEGAEKPSMIGTWPASFSSGGWAAFARIDPPKDATTLERTIPLDPGVTYVGQIVDADGRRVAGSRYFSFVSGRWTGMDDSSFTIRGLNPRRPRPHYFVHDTRELAGVLEPSQDPSLPLTMRLQPSATLSGQIVDAEGRPRPELYVRLEFQMPGMTHATAYRDRAVQTDKTGRFRLTGLLPGGKYLLIHGKSEADLGKAGGPGEHKDLGPVRLP